MFWVEKRCPHLVLFIVYSPINSVLIAVSQPPMHLTIARDIFHSLVALPVKVQIVLLKKWNDGINSIILSYTFLRNKNRIKRKFQQLSKPLPQSFGHWLIFNILFGKILVWFWIMQFFVHFWSFLMIKLVSNNTGHYFIVSRNIGTPPRNSGDFIPGEGGEAL